MPDADFFERVSERDLAAQPYLGRADLGKIKRSFANLLVWHRPIVIMDEAHNAQSSLSLDVLKRIRAACVIEWTATPAQDQNLLYHVSAQELKAAHMIKLPIVLAPHPNWQESVRDAVLTRDVLAREAAAQYDLGFDNGTDGIRREDVLRVLDRRLRRDAILQPDMIAWLGRMLDGLAAHGFELTYLARHLNDLADAAAAQLAKLLKGEKRIAFQRSLLAGPQQVRIDHCIRFHFDPQVYPARWLYPATARYKFRKHYYPLPGELKEDIDAEETACAIALDRLDAVKRWVRNLERQPDASFWLPTSSDRFYPDFVAELTDGRLFALEYKGGDRYSNDDSKEKRDIGAVWAAASDGRCVFAMATDAATAGMSVDAQLRRALAG